MKKDPHYTLVHDPALTLSSPSPTQEPSERWFTTDSEPESQREIRFWQPSGSERYTPEPSHLQ
jgi:hypothetical protein